MQTEGFNNVKFFNFGPVMALTHVKKVRGIVHVWVACVTSFSILNIAEVYSRLNNYILIAF